VSFIRIEESDFLRKSAEVNFADGEFRFTKTAISSKFETISAAEVKSLNRLRAKKVSGTNTNIFQNHFIGGPVIAMIMEMFGFASATKKLDRRIVVHFKNGKFFSGKTDLETFFEVQNAWLDSKDNGETA
jgi:hypothetical protein